MSESLIWSVLNPPDEALSAVIRKALNEEEDKLENNVRLLQEWITCQGHLPKNYDRRILYAYIRGAKHILENAKQKIERYFVSRTIHKDLFDNRILSLDHDLNATTFMHSSTMPDLTPEGYRVTAIKIFNTDIEVFNPLKLLRLSAIFGELRMHEENFTAGEVLIIDCEHLTASVGAKMLASQMKEIIVLMQNAFPVLVKQVHVISDNAIIVNGANILKQFMKEKIRNRVHFHKNPEALSDFIPLGCLPKDYGGTQASIEDISKKWQEVLGSYGPLFRKIDEVKLLGPVPKHLSQNMQELGHGLEGSFRKLNID